MNGRLSEVFEEIASAVEITSDVEFRFAGETCRYDQAEPCRQPQCDRGSWLSLVLADRIYARCYVTPFHATAVAVDRDDYHGAADPELVAALDAANDSKTGWDPRWRINEVQPTGHVMVCKDERVLRANPGQYVIVGDSHVEARVGTLVDVRVFRGYHAANFFYAAGTTLASQDDSEQLVRFYLNADATIAPGLVAYFTRELNRFFVPFRLKCPRSAAAFARCDSFVLYAPRRYFQMAARLVAELDPALLAALAAHTPLFTKHLHDGVGFAEDPGNQASFGDHRTQLVATGIIEAWRCGDTSTEQRVASIRRVFEAEGLDLSRPYLNPSSVDVFELPAPVESMA